MQIWIAAAACVLLCGCGEKPTTLEELKSTEIVFPNGTKILAENMRTQSDMMRGMMFRDSLPADRGMLFFHAKEGAYTYYMYQVRIPLDIIWLDHDRRIVEIARDVPGCKSSSAQGCPTYGGHAQAMYVIEVNAGFAAKNGLQAGERVEF